MAKGDKSVLAMSVNDIKADENGNVALTAANVGADTAGAAQVVQGNLQAHIIDSVIHMTQDERDDLAAKLSELSAAISANSSALANKMNRSGDSMGGNLNFGAHQLHFDVGGENGFHLHKDPQALYIRDHDGHVLMTFGYGRIPTVYGNAPIATATKPAVYDLPLAAGIESDGPIKYWRAQDNTVYLRGSVSKPSPGFVNNEHIGSLPVGFRPEYDLTFPAILATPSAPAVLRVNLDGSIRLVDVPNSQGNFLKFCVFFQAA